MLIVERLSTQHDKKGFDCGNDLLNRFLQQFAKQYSQKGLSQTHVLIDSENPTQILGFYTLSNLHILPENFSPPAKNYPTTMLIPACLIGRLAVDYRFSGQGMSRKLLAHALASIKLIAQTSGIAFVLVDAKDSNLVSFYEKFGFKQISTNNLRLALAVNELLP